MPAIEPRDLLRKAFDAAVRAVDPYAAIAENFKVDAGKIICAGGETFGGRSWERAAFDAIRVVGCGKAGAPMAKAVVENSDNLVKGGLIVVKQGHTGPGEIGYGVETVEADHPVPDERGRAGAKKTIDFLGGFGSRDFVVAVISGGGSALWSLPANGISLSEKKLTTDLLLGCGADIAQINCVRKHISAIKGGQAAQACNAGAVCVLVMSDVVGDYLDVIASGPFYPDRTTFADAYAVLSKFQLLESIPGSVRTRIEEGTSGKIADNPGVENSCFQKAFHCICASNGRALKAASDVIGSMGVPTTVVTSQLTGDINDAAQNIINIARVNRNSHSVRPFCLLFGGETTVRLPKAHGKGGRNQQLAITIADLMQRETFSVSMISAGTDGTDGPTDAAGAFIDSETIARGSACGLDYHKYLKNNDAYTYFEHIGDLLISGPTMTNVMDLQAVIVW